ncbi:MAG: hypothetical protein VZQ48_04870, partial [Candidatus Cryptobacteroides sp.]|nr:hypothetical protein [Candidatus Cryptobacteroides sp.]
SKTMEPVDINSKELQELKSEFNDLKETLNKQRIVNKELLAQVQKQKASFIGKDLAKRMSMDIITIPMIIVICHAVGWPMWFAAAVSIWALIDLVAVLVGRKKFDTQKMLDDDVLTAAKTVKEYKRFYHLSVVIGAIPAVALVAFVLIRIYTQSAPDENMLFPTAIYIFTCVAGVLYAVKTYRKMMEACDNLIESLENE